MAFMNFLAIQFAGALCRWAYIVFKTTCIRIEAKSELFMSCAQFERKCT